MAVAMVVLYRMFPQSENGVRSDDRGSLLTVPRGDDLIEEIRSLLIESEVAKLVADEQHWLGVGFQLANDRMIDLRSRELIQHIHRSRE